MPLILYLFSLIFPFLYKYSFVITNQYTQIPIVLLYMNPDYLPNDWYVNISREFGPRTIFAVYMAFWGKLIGLPLTYFIHYILTILLTLWASYNLGVILFRNRKAAVLSSLTVLFAATYSLGGNMLVTRDFTVTQLALSVSLVSIVLTIKSKYFFSSILFAISSYLHPLIGPEVAIICFASSVFIKRLSVIKSGLIPYFFSVFPLLFFYLKDVRSDIPTELKISIVAFMRTPHHFLPAFFPWQDYVSFLTLLILSLFLITREKNLIHDNIKKFLLYFCLIICVLIIISLFSIYVFRFYPGIILQPFRLTVYIYWFAALVVFNYFYKEIFTGNLPGFFSFLPLFLSDYSRLIFSGKTDTVAVLLGIFIILILRKLSIKILLILLLIFFSLFQFHEKFNYNSLYLFPTAETILAEWVNKNTPNNAIFLVPPEFEKFRLVSERAIVADWKAFPFQEAAFYEWFLRIRAISGQSERGRNLTRENAESGYRNLDIDKIFDLSGRYGVNYFISETEYPALNKIRDGKYKIFKL